MIPIIRAAAAAETASPRTRGDDPAADTADKAPQDFSPHPRG